MMMTEADKALTKDWSGPIGDAFFTDDSMATLKSEDEIKSSWSSLSTEQQAQVKQDCATVSSSTASAPGAGTSTDTTASTTPDTSGPAAGTDTTASTTPPAASGGTSTDTTASTTTGTTTGGAAGSGTYSTAMTDLCSMVSSM
jgi:hypothetical protein